MVIKGLEKKLMQDKSIINVMEMEYMIEVVKKMKRIERKEKEKKIEVIGKNQMKVLVEGKIMEMVEKVMKIVKKGGMNYEKMLIEKGIVMKLEIEY